MARDETAGWARYSRSGPRICTNTREHLRMLAHATRTRDQWLADHLSRNTRVLASRGKIDTALSFRWIFVYVRVSSETIRVIFGLFGTVYLSFARFFASRIDLKPRWKQSISFRRTIVKICILLYTTR